MQNGQTALFLATALDSVDVVALLLDMESSNNPLASVDAVCLDNAISLYAVKTTVAG